MREFIDTDLAGQTPVTVCEGCARRSTTHVPTDSQFCHCKHTKTGAGRVAGGEWKILEGISIEEFYSFLVHTVIEGEARIAELVAEERSPEVVH